MSFTLPTGHRLGTPTPLFRKIEDEEVANEEANLVSRATPQPVPAVPQVPAASIEDFHKIKMEVIEVVHAEVVPKSKKLLLLQVATKSGPRQIVSGIASHFQPEQLVGKRLVACVNLQTARIKGLESQGMILAAQGEDGALHLVEMPSAPVGAEIS